MGEIETSDLFDGVGYTKMTVCKECSSWEMGESGGVQYPLFR